MATVTTRAGKGSPLTHAEVDANFTNLNNDKAETSHTHTLSDITDAGTAAAADTTDFDTAGSAVALAIALG
jgi:hypothetical protein